VRAFSCPTIAGIFAVLASQVAVSPCSANGVYHVGQFSSLTKFLKCFFIFLVHSAITDRRTQDRNPAMTKASFKFHVSVADAVVAVFQNFDAAMDFAVHNARFGTTKDGWLVRRGGRTAVTCVVKNVATGRTKTVCVDNSGNVFY
jgi:hypothetical protein